MTAFRISAWRKALAAGWSAIIQSIAASLRALEREAELRSAEQTLEGCPALLLKDIGISRGSLGHQVLISRGRTTMARSGAARSRAGGSEPWPFGSAGAAGFEGDEEDGDFAGLEAFDEGGAIFGLAGELEEGDVVFFQVRFYQSEHGGELGEEQDAAAFL